MTAVFGIVLVGGASSRMGTDKASLTWAGRSFADAAAQALAPMCCEIRRAGGPPGPDALADAADQAGPLAGVVSGLRAANATGCDRLVVVSCDAPALVAEDVRLLLDQPAPSCFLNDDGTRWPLPCVLPTDCLPTADAALKSGRRSLMRLLADLDTTGPLIGDRAARLLGANTPEDLAAYRLSFEPSGP